MAIISEVSEVRNLLPAMDCNAIEMFSLSEVFTGIPQDQKFCAIMTMRYAGLLQPFIDLNILPEPDSSMARTCDVQKHL